MNMAKIPAFLHEPLKAAYPAHVCLVASVRADGYAQVTPRGSVQAYDDEHISIWERGKGSTNAALGDGSKLTVFFRNPEMRDRLPGGVARFYGTASIHKAGPVYDAVWERLIENEKKGDPEKKGFAVLIRIERAEKINGQPLEG
jgi:predicted pyridoxine 5'-phosphate oxidase superfamily flavin-nucleotide-binding protein